MTTHTYQIYKDETELKYHLHHEHGVPWKDVVELDWFDLTHLHQQIHS